MIANVKVALLGGAMMAIASGAASAADLGPYQPYNPPAPEPVVNYQPSIWEGAYIGVNGGYGWSNSGYGEPSGGFGGAQIGYNWQRDRFVFGVEADFQGADISGHEFGAFHEARSDVDWFSTVRGRAGIASGPWLLYATGGVAFADIDNRIAFDDGTSFRKDGTRTGYVVGGGLEYALSRNWTMKAEYLYLGMGNDNLVNDEGFETRVNNDIQTVRVGLNYKF
ncbi:porin family protein [Hyphomicrobium methylovorum]|uniref:outer membrane protein n=1 Tax=Hyphomicrobium methylovorum TaxID=84 RepID=UPI0015E63D25|nr:outer membrane protein [Hyphomicrobium methylovorum]MBA2125760.1 porin family protein [Hyphomicrobium methylovorum]